MRWRLSDGMKLEAQKGNTYREASDPQHTVNLGYFHTGDLHEIPGYNPGAFRSDPQLGEGLHQIHPATMSESVQFYGGRNAGSRPSGSFSPSSHHSEAALEEQQGMPAGYGDEYR